MFDLSRRAFLAGTSLVVVAKSSLAIPSVAWGAPKTGVAAPVFTATDTGGKAVSLGDQHGKIVVLEWTNHDCPYVRKHYDAGNMQNLQKEATGQGVVWLTVISSAPGTQGHVGAGQANELTKTRKASPTAVLFDPTGTVGKAYGATSTPSRARTPSAPRRQPAASSVCAAFSGLNSKVACGARKRGGALRYAPVA